MDANVSAVLEKKINRTIGNLQNNKMDAYYVKTLSLIHISWKRIYVPIPASLRRR